MIMEKQVQNYGESVQISLLLEYYEVVRFIIIKYFKVFHNICVY
jgi:hypothetical protein